MAETERKLKNFMTNSVILFKKIRIVDGRFLPIAGSINTKGLLIHSNLLDLNYPMCRTRTRPINSTSTEFYTFYVRKIFPILFLIVIFLIC